MTDTEKFIENYKSLKVNLLTVCATVVGVVAVVGQIRGLSIFIKLSVISLVLTILVGFAQLINEVYNNIWDSIFDSQKKMIEDFEKIKKSDVQSYNKYYKKIHEDLISKYRKRSKSLLEYVVDSLHLNADIMETLFYFFFIAGFVFLAASIF